MNTQANRAPLPPISMQTQSRHTGHLHDVLAEHDVLGLLNPQEQQTLLRWSVIRRLDRQEVLLRRDDPPRSVILVLAGYIKLSTTCPDREVILDVAGPGDIIGDAEVLNNRELQADASTLTRCRILAIDARQFLQTVEHSPNGRAVIVKLMGGRLLRATDLVIDALGLAAPARLARVLLRLASLRSFAAEHGGSPLRISQSELGAMAGIARESVNKLLAGWRQNGWITLSNGCLVSVDVAALSEVAQAH